MVKILTNFLIQYFALKKKCSTTLNQLDIFLYFLLLMYNFYVSHVGLSIYNPTLNMDPEKGALLFLT